MRILYLTAQMAQIGGLERVLAVKLNYLAEQTDNEVHLIVSEQCGRPFSYQLSDKVHVYDLHLPASDMGVVCRNYLIAGLITLLPRLWKIGRKIKKIKPDIIIEPNFIYDYWILPYIKCGAKLIREMHSSEFDSKNRNILIKRLDFFTQRKYDRLVVLTPEEINFFKFRLNLTVIPNPIPDSDFKSTQKEKVVITVGRLDPVKQYEHFIEIASRLVDEFPEWKFKIYGGGDKAYVESLQSLIDAKGITNKILLCGPSDKVFQEMSKASICVCTSKTESFGLTLAEAMESGLTNVSYDCPNGPRNIIDNNEDGFLVKPDSIEDAVAALRTLMSDQDLRKQFSRRALENVRRFHTENIMQQWLQLFDDLIKK